MFYVDLMVYEDDEKRLLGRFELIDNKVQIKASEEDKKRINVLLEDGMQAPIDLQNLMGPCMVYQIEDGKDFLERLKFGFCGTYCFATEMKTTE